MHSLMRWPALLGCCLPLALMVPPQAAAWADTPARAMPAIVAKVIPAVVKIVTVKRPKQEPPKPGQNATPASQEVPITAIGSGFVINSTGFIATNKHVIEDAISVFVQTSDGVRHRASIVGVTSKADMALLRISSDAPLPTVAFGDSDKMQVGDTVIAVGNPFGFDETVTAGIVSAVNRNIMESPFDDYIQTDAPINHGNSGGPLFNVAGEVIGMNSVIFAPGTYSGSVGLGFAIPSNSLRFVMDRLIKDGKVQAGMLPIRTQQVSWLLKLAIDTPGMQGALVDALNPGGDEMMGGQIKPGDVILSFNGHVVTDPRDLAREAAKTPIGSTAALDIFRDGKQRLVHVTIHGWPEGQIPKIDDKPPGTLGLQLSKGPDDGVLITAVEPTGSAADSGILQGDVILQVQQQLVSTPDEALQALKGCSDAKRHFAALLVERDKQRTWIPIALPEE